MEKILVVARWAVDVVDVLRSWSDGMVDAQLNALGQVGEDQKAFVIEKDGLPYEGDSGAGRKLWQRQIQIDAAGIARDS